VSSPEHGPDPVTFVTHAAHTRVLHTLDPHAFPLPHHSLAERPLSGTPGTGARSARPLTCRADVPGLPEHTTLLRSNTVVHMRPARAPEAAQHGAEDPFHPTLGTEPALEQPVQEAFDTARAAVTEEAARRAAVAAGVPTAPGDDIEVLALGTGSAVPSKHRNGKRRTYDVQHAR
jgi:ribonuclease Z